MLHLTMAAFADEASRSPEGQIAALRRNGIGLLEIRFVGDKNIAELTAEEAKGLRRRLEEEGIGVWSLGSPTGKISLRDDFSARLVSFWPELIERPPIPFEYEGAVETARILEPELVPDAPAGVANVGFSIQNGFPFGNRMKQPGI